MTDYIHKEFPLNDEELGCRDSAETLVNSYEEEGTHPLRDKKANLVIRSLSQVLKLTCTV